MIEITEEIINKEVENFAEVMDRYGDQIPRFMVDGMNSSELIIHIMNFAFLRGIEFERTSKEETCRDQEQKS